MRLPGSLKGFSGHVDVETAKRTFESKFKDKTKNSFIGVLSGSPFVKAAGKHVVPIPSTPTHAHIYALAQSRFPPPPYPYPYTYNTRVCVQARRHAPSTQLVIANTIQQDHYTYACAISNTNLFQHSLR
jgi:hypothetical protein